MFSSNGFNVCPHCGKANSLNARFCASCGKQLTVPQEVVVCPKCHKTNSPMATYCGACGAPLRTNTSTKICPRCGREVSVSDNICSCGYSFAATTSATAKDAKRSKARNHNYKGGKVLALVGMILLLIFAYFVVAPSKLRPEFLTEWDKGIWRTVQTVEGSEEVTYSNNYGLSAVMTLVNQIMAGGESFNNYVSQKLPEFVLCALTVITMLTMVLHFIVCVVRLFTGRRSKRSNGLLLILAAITTLWMSFAAICYFIIPANTVEWLLFLRNAFVPAVPTGWVALALPLYFWFFYIYSACAKVHKIKEQVV